MSTDYSESFSVSGGKIFGEFDVGKEDGGGIRLCKEAKTITEKFFSVVSGERMTIMTPNKLHMVYQKDLKAFLQRQGINVSDRADKKELLAAYREFVNTRIFHVPRLSESGEITGSHDQLSRWFRKLQEAGFDLPKETLNDLTNGKRTFSMADLTTTKKTQDGLNALLYVACKERNGNLAKVLLGQDADPTAQNKCGRTPFHEVCCRGDLEMADLLLLACGRCNFNEMIDKDGGATPLHEACRRGDLKTAVWLAQRGAKLTTEDEDGRTPIKVATDAGYPEVGKILQELVKANFQGLLVKKALLKATFEKSLPPGGILGITLSGDKVSGKRSTFTQFAQQLRDDGFEGMTFPNIEGKPSVDKISFSIKDLERKPLDAFLYLACRHGDTPFAKALLDAGANPYVRDRNGNTLLHDAFARGYLEMGILLAEYGAGLTTKDDKGQTPIDVAKNCNHRWMIADVRRAWRPNNTHFDFAGFKNMLPDDQVGAKNIVDSANETQVNQADYDGLTPLHMAAKYGANEEIFDLLIKKGAKVDVKNNAGNTPLHFVCQQRLLRETPIEAVDLLLEKVEDPNIVGQGGMTPLHYASQYADVDAMERLIKKGADPNKVNTSGKTALDLAMETENTACIDLLEKAIQKPAKVAYKEPPVKKALLKAASDKPPLRQEPLYGLEVRGGTFSGEKQRFDTLILALDGAGFEVSQELRKKTKGVETDTLKLSMNDLAKEIDGGIDALLYLACKEGNTSLAKTLLEAGANPYVRDKKGMTPLHNAFDKGDREIAILLAANGASLEAKHSTRDGQTPVDIATKAGNTSMIANVRGAWKPSRSFFDFGWLERTLASGDYNSAKELIDKADEGSVNTVSAQGFSPLHLLIEMRGGERVRQVGEICQMLIDKGADAEKKDASGKTPLDLAREKNDVKIRTILEKAIRGDVTISGDGGTEDPFPLST